jgi:hypothetical protein
MIFDIRKIETSKRLFRRKLAQLPITEKLRILEQLRGEKLPKHRNPRPASRKEPGQTR